MIRVSTETQNLEDQKNEMISFCHQEGYQDLIFVEDKGASAIKLNDSYKMMIEQVKEEIQEKIQVLEEKTKATRKRLEKVEEKEERIKELYVDGIIKKEELEKRLTVAKKEGEWYRNTILSFEEQTGGLLQILEGENDDSPDLEKLKGVYKGVIGEKNIKIMDEIIKRQIRKVTSRPYEFKGRKSAQIITVETTFSGERKFIYVARKYKGHYFFNEKGESLVTILKIVRESAGELHPRAFKKIKDW